MSKTVKLEIEISPENLARIDELVERSGLPGRKELFSNALSLLEWAAKEVKAGRVIASIDDVANVYKELHMDVLEKLKPTVTQS